jgi:malate permease and related proteins
MSALFLSVIPILSLISFGLLVQKKKWMSTGAIDEIKKGVTNVALPAVLFLSFVNLELKKEYFWVMVMIAVLMVLCLAIGIGLNHIPAISHPLNPFMVSACTFGLLGIPLFSTAFGMDNIGKLSILGVGHEFFVWFIYFTYLEMKLCKKKFSVEMMKGFAKSPLILMVLLGIILNLTGYGRLLYTNPILKGVYATMQHIANLATPLVLMIVGYGLKLEKSYLKQSLRFVVLRYVVMLTVGYIFKFMVIDRTIVGDKLFDYAYFTLLILPQPLILPVFVAKFGTEEQYYLVNNAAVLSTFLCVSVFLLFITLI